MSAHSPGPWKGDDFNLIVSSIQSDPKKYRIEQATIVDQGGNEVCRIVHDPDDGFDLVKDRVEHEANANLIAAAPDMLEALAAVAPLMVPGMNWTDETGQLVKRMVLAAIAKAEGK